MAKPRLLRYRPNPYEGPGDGADEAGGEEGEKGKGGGEGEGKERAAHNPPPLSRRDR